MKKLGYDYETAVDGLQAVEKYTSNPESYQCVLMGMCLNRNKHHAISDPRANSPMRKSSISIDVTTIQTYPCPYWTGFRLPVECESMSKLRGYNPRL